MGALASKAVLSTTLAQRVHNQLQSGCEYTSMQVELFLFPLEPYFSFVSDTTVEPVDLDDLK